MAYIQSGMTAYTSSCTAYNWTYAKNHFSNFIDLEKYNFKLNKTWADWELNPLQPKRANNKLKKYNAICACYALPFSTIAMGSGGVLGKGWLNGTQSQLEFLPERSTDFIFAVYGEEFGLLGNLVLILLFALLIG